MNIQIIQHGIAKIVLPVTYPASVEINTPFDIVYTTRNNGAVADTLWGHLVVNGAELQNSAWTETVNVNETVTKTYTHPGLTETTTITIEVGHQ